jgi:uncharacterized protein
LNNVFADTSALVKRYVIALGSGWVRGWASSTSSTSVVISSLTIVETVAALARRQRQGLLSASTFVHLRDNFLLHVDHEYVLVSLEHGTLVNAADLAVQHALRSLDAIQLACALEYRRTTGTLPTFVSADRNLLAAAAAEGFPVEDPNAYP